MVTRMCDDDMMFCFVLFLLIPKSWKKVNFFHLVNIKSLTVVFQIELTKKFNYILTN